METTVFKKTFSITVITARKAIFKIAYFELLLNIQMCKSYIIKITGHQHSLCVR